ncbi:unnamed protein product [Urochloa humidicola]
MGEDGSGGGGARRERSEEPEKVVASTPASGTSSETAWVSGEREAEAGQRPSGSADLARMLKHNRRLRIVRVATTGWGVDFSQTPSTSAPRRLRTRAATMAAALRLLSRRRAAAPATLAPLLRPLIPASTELFSKPPYPLHAMGAAGLLDLHRAQLCPSPVPSLLRLYSGKGFATPVREQPTHHQATCRLKKAGVSEAAILPCSRRVQLSLLPMPSLIRHFSSMGNVLPPLRQPIAPNSTRYLKVLGLALFLLMVSNWIGIRRLYVGNE